VNRIFLIFITILSISILNAQDKGLIEVRAEVDTAVITIGDRITYSIIIDRLENLRIARPGEGLNLGGFEIKSYNFPEPQLENGRITERFDFNISVYDTGKYAIPPFPVAYFLDDTTSKYSIIEAPAIDIYVNSVMTGEDAGELKDVKAPIDIPFNYFFWFSMAAIAIMLIYSGWLIYYLIKKRREKGYLFSPPVPPKPAHEIALAELDKLFASDLIEQEEFKLFFSQLSEIMRIYFEGRYYLSALEETTAEIIHDLKDHVQEEMLIESIKQLLILSDLVKFAKHKPEPEDVQRSKTQALDFVNNTKLVFQPEDELIEAPKQEEITNV